VIFHQLRNSTRYHKSETTAWNYIHNRWNICARYSEHWCSGCWEQCTFATGDILSAITAPVHWIVTKFSLMLAIWVTRNSTTCSELWSIFIKLGVLSVADPGIWNGGGRLPSLPLEVDPLNPARESGRAFKLPQQGLAVWECSPAGGNLVHFSLKIWHLLATISITSGESTDQILWILNSKGKSGPSHPFLVHRTNWLRRDGMIYDSSPLTVSTNKTWDFKTEETAKYQVSLCIVSQLAFYN